MESLKLMPSPDGVGRMPLNPIPQPCETTSVANWLNENPIRLTVAAGRVAKSDLANALHITTASLRHKIAVLRDSDPAFDDLRACLNFSHRATSGQFCFMLRYPEFSGRHRHPAMAANFALPETKFARFRLGTEI